MAHTTLLEISCHGSYMWNNDMLNSPVMAATRMLYTWEHTNALFTLYMLMLFSDKICKQLGHRSGATQSDQDPNCLYS